MQSENGEEQRLFANVGTTYKKLRRHLAQTTGEEKAEVREYVKTHATRVTISAKADHRG